MNLFAPGSRSVGAASALSALLAVSAAAQTFAPPLSAGVSGPSLPLLSPCDLSFGGADCLPVASLLVSGAKLGERFVGQTAAGATGQNETLSGAPSSPLTLASAAANDGLSEYLGTITGLGGTGCNTDSFGEGLVSVLFDQPQQRVLVTPQFLDGGTGTARAYAANGSLVATKTGNDTLELLAGASPIRGVTLSSADAGGLGWTVYAEPWNAVAGIDPMTALNGLNHHTDQFTSGLQVRRGEAAGVQLRVTLGAAFDPTVNELHFRVQHAFDGPPTVIALDPFGSDPAQWTSQILAVSADGLTVDCRLNVPVDAAAGEYLLTAELWLVNCLGPTLVDEAGLAPPMVVLFNPWAPADGVFLNAGMHDEYLLSDHTIIWRGDPSAPVPWTWRYAAFGADSLAALLAGLQGQPSAVRRDPVLAARRLAAYTDAQGGGLLDVQLVGPWLGGTAPQSWTGSDQVFAAWVAGGKVPVKYGVDWTAAGVLASLCRTLGIGSRPVTGYAAARDVDTLPGALDVAFTATGHLDMGASIDRLWDTHAWTEVFLRRPDLVGANGWQALDGTSMLPGVDGQAGPASVAKILLNEVSAPYDVSYWRALVDSDLRIWRLDGAGQEQLISSATNVVGKSLLTKAQGVDSAANVTFAYKPGLLPPPGPAGILPGSGIDVSFHPPVSVAAGQPLAWSVTLHNPTTLTQTAHVALDGHVLGADGQPAGLLGTLDVNVPLPQFAINTVTLTVQPADYAQWLDVGQQFQASLGVDVPAAGDLFADFGRTQLQLPDVDLTVTPSHSTTVGGSLTVKASLVNPLPVPLTNVSVTFAAAPGLSFGGQAQVTVPLGTVAAGAPIVVSKSVKGTDEGSLSVSVAVSSDQLAGAAGATTITVGSAWKDLGQGLAGIDGIPLLVGEGSLQPGSAGDITLHDAAPLATCSIFFGLSQGGVPFKGGVLVPFPVTLTIALKTDASGNLLLAWSAWPSGLPAGTTFILQAWTLDAAGPKGLSASNALRGTAP